MATPTRPRPLVFDLTHLVSRLPKVATTGIDRIDLAYANHFAAEGGMAAGIHYGLLRPHLLSPNEAQNTVGFASSLWARDDAGRDSHFLEVRDWLASPPRRSPAKPVSLSPAVSRAQWSRRLHQARDRLLNDKSLSVPEGAIYLNVAQHLFEHALFFRWLKRRPDVRAVFMIHDLLPLDYPEFFSSSNLAVFRRRIGTALNHAHAFIVSTEAVKARLETEIRRLGSRPRPIWSHAFPSPLESGQTLGESATGSGHPYFVMLGTIEPRKNHLMLLHLWRALVRQDPDAPRLTLVGVRGWENEQVADMLDRSAALGDHILEIRGLASADLVELLSGARALLMPSFDEGYGLPLVEALSLGTPVVASDIPVFREVTQNCATFLSPLNGEAWGEAILRLVADEDYLSLKRRQAQAFRAPAWPDYFDKLNVFLAGL